MTPSRSRTAFIDLLRILLTVLVILHHVAIEYGGAGGWYWREQPNGSNLPLILFNATNQSFFMGFFFMLAGYFTPSSYEKKGPRRFLVERFLRLGVPLVIYFFLVSPLTIALSGTASGRPLWSSWGQLILQRQFEPGPLWFAEALLIFALLYCGWRTVWRRGGTEVPHWPGPVALVTAALAIGVVSFLVRLVIPTGQNLLWLQLGYFPGYVVLFCFGCWASRGQLLERVTWRMARPWLVLSLLAITTLPVVLATNFGSGKFEGGWSSRAAIYAAWDPLVAWGVILTLLASFKKLWPTAGPVSEWFGQHAYAAFCIHPPVVVGLSLAFHAVSMPPILKFVLVGTSAAAGSFLVAGFLRAIPGAKRVL